MKKYNNIQPDNTLPKSLKKSDLLFFCGLASLVIFFGAYFNKKQELATIIALIAIVLIFVFYLVKTIKKVLSQKDIGFYMGVVGLVGFFTENLLLAVNRGNTAMNTVVIFAIATAISAVIFILFYFLFCKIAKRRNYTILTGTIAPFAVLGVLMSQYFRKNGIEIPLDILVWLLSLILAMLSASQFAMIKTKQIL